MRSIFRTENHSNISGFLSIFPSILQNIAVFLLEENCWLLHLEKIFVPLGSYPLNDVMELFLVNLQFTITVSFTWSLNTRPDLHLALLKVQPDLYNIFCFLFIIYSRKDIQSSIISNHVECLINYHYWLFQILCKLTKIYLHHVIFFSQYFLKSKPEFTQWSHYI